MNKLYRNIAFLIICFYFGACTKNQVDKLPNVAEDRKIVTSSLPGLTIAELRAKNIQQDSVYVTNENGINGTWTYDPADITSNDNLGTILINFEGKRLKRVLLATDMIRSEWFGLKGDGTDETILLQAAINASAGRKLLLNTGIYFSKKLNLVSHFVLAGDHAGLRNIQGDNTDNIFINLWNLTDVEITGVEIALNGIRGDIWSGTAAVQIQNCSDIRINNCFIHDNTYVGIRLTGGNTRIVLNHNTIENTDTGIHANNNNSDVTITGNIITKGTSEGITIYGYSDANIPFNFLIDSNIIQHKENSFGINIAYAKLGRITHNTISNCLGGITLHDVVSVGSENHYTTDMVITNNMITNSGFGIICIGDRTVVSDNILSNIQQDGINANNYPDESIVTQNVTISNNDISAPGLAGGGRGGISVRNLQNSKIENNVISKCGKVFGLRFDGNCENLSITGNNLNDGMLQSTTKIYDKQVLITGNKLPGSYFPSEPANPGQFKLVVSGNMYTTDTSFNTAPDDNGYYNEINTFDIRTAYVLAAGTVKNIMPSWTGRIIRFKSTGSFTAANKNNIHLKEAKDVTVISGNSISLQYDGNNWNEISRTF